MEADTSTMVPQAVAFVSIQIIGDLPYDVSSARGYLLVDYSKMAIYPLFTSLLPLFIWLSIECAQMPGLATTPPTVERQTERRRVPRIPFKATSVVTETGSSQMVVAQTIELSRFGCFVQTTKPYPKGTRVHLELADCGDVFTASGVVAYVTGDGMGVVFSMVEPENYEILAKWLSRTPRRSDRYSFGATAEVKEIGSWKEQVREPTPGR